MEPARSMQRTAASVRGGTTQRRRRTQGSPLSAAASVAGPSVTGSAGSAGALLVVIANLLADLVHAWLDPRVRTA